MYGYQSFWIQVNFLPIIMSYFDDLVSPIAGYKSFRVQINFNYLMFNDIHYSKHHLQPDMSRFDTGKLLLCHILITLFFASTE